MSCSEFASSYWTELNQQLLLLSKKKKIRFRGILWDLDDIM